MEANNQRRKTLYSAGRNKEHIAEVLVPRIEAIRPSGDSSIRLLEIASGTGEHANCILSKIKNIIYQPTEMDVGMFDSINAWLEDFPDHALPAQRLDVNAFDPSSFPSQLQLVESNVDVILCINMVHISPWQSTINLFRLASQSLRSGGFVMTYGPYCVQGSMTESNVAFDASLKARNPEWGVRDLEAVEEVAKQYGFVLKEFVEMPSNNLSVIFETL